MLAASVVWAAGLLFSSSVVNAAAVVEPADGHLYLGAWLDTSHKSGDNPAAINERVGFNFASFQFAQDIPLPPYNYTTGGGGPINLTFIENSGTDASLFLTVYPTGPANATQEDWTALGQQILIYQSAPYNRSVFLRYGPEMNGNWFKYGMMPAQFVADWISMHTAVSAVAPDTAFVWSPNFGIGYPYGYSLSNPMPGSTPADLAALDTNGDGQLTAADDCYSPYFPGFQYVDWIGMSLYWKGTTWPYSVNQVTDPNFLVRAMNGYVPGDTQEYAPFYSRYCTTKPCALSESAAAYHVNTTSGPGPGQVAIQESWLDLFWNNTNSQDLIISAYPRIKMIQLFEEEKVEDQYDLRDFRLTNDTDTRNMFLAKIQPFIANGTILTANSAPTQAVTTHVSGSASPSATASATAAATSATAAPVVAVVVTQSGAHTLMTSTVAAAAWTFMLISSFTLVMCT